MASSVLLIGVTITLLVVSFFLFHMQKKEGFVTQGYSVNDLDINTCPTFAPEIQTAKGKTDCCQGEMIDGKCNSTTFCTKSPAYDGVLSCVDIWRSYFSKKGAEFCPATMPNYYEDVTNSQAGKGCSVSAIAENGKSPKEGTQKQCTIYATEELNRTKKDSCYLEKERLKIQCPVVNGRSPEALMHADTRFQYFYCQYPFEIGMPDKCYDKTSIYAYYDRTNPNWRTGDSLTEMEDSTCEKYSVKRERSRKEAERLAEEKRRREAAETNLRALQSKWDEFWGRFQKQQTDSSRLQQQLDEANRKAQQCKK